MTAHFGVMRYEPIVVDEVGGEVVEYAGTLLIGSSEGVWALDVRGQVILRPRGS